jgi:hypothetical protein
MKRLIRNKRTGQFLKSEGSWTKASSEAMSYPNVRSVIAAKDQFNLRDVEIVLMVQEKPSRYDVVLPLDYSSDDEP